MDLYSHSRLSSYENCPRQFRYRYIEKIETQREGVEAFVGKRVHEILERLYHHLARHGKPPSLAQVLDRFDKDWPLHWHDEVHIVRPEADVAYYQELGVRCLENYYRGHYPFDDGQTVGIEQQIQATLDDGQRYRIRGIVDRIVKHGTGRYEIIDYKTGSLPPRKRFEQDRQLALYQIGLEQTYDDVEEVELVWHYLAFDKTLTSSRTPEQLQMLRRDTIELIDRIEAATEYPAVPGPLCRWCDYREICPEGGLRDSLGPIGPEPPAPGVEVRRAPAAASAAAAPEADRPAEPVQLSLL